MNRGVKFTVERDISTPRKGSLSSFQFECKRDIRMLAVRIVKKKRYMIQGFEKKKIVINVTSIQKRFEDRRTVIKARGFFYGKTLARRGPRALHP